MSPECPIFLVKSPSIKVHNLQADFWNFSLTVWFLIISSDSLTFWQQTRPTGVLLRHPIYLFFLCNFGCAAVHSLILVGSRLVRTENQYNCLCMCVFACVLTLFPQQTCRDPILKWTFLITHSLRTRQGTCKQRRQCNIVVGSHVQRVSLFFWDGIR